MNFPFEYFKAQSPPCDDISNLSPNSDYVACFGKSKRLGFLGELSGMRTLWVSGINDKQESKIPLLRNLEILIIHDYRGCRLDILGKTPKLKQLLIRGGRKVSELSSLLLPDALEVIGLEDFPGLRSLDDLGNASNLRMLYLSGGESSSLKVHSLKPISGLQNLELLHLRNLIVGDGSLSFAVNLGGLKKLQVSNQFETIEYASLKAQCPHLDCTLFAPYVEGSTTCEKCGANEMMVIGKRKPVICPVCFPEKLENYKTQFDNLTSAGDHKS